MFCTDYPIGALTVLLDSACVTGRYAPLIPWREVLLSGLGQAGCRTKGEAQRMTDEELLRAGLPDLQTVCLLRRFLVLYDPAPAKFREIEKITVDPEAQAVLRELYHLPGVRYTRANLYCLAGYRSLWAVADAAPEEILERTEQAIRTHGLTCIAPLPKESRTHIAVARAFLWDEWAGSRSCPERDIHKE